MWPEVLPAEFDALRELEALLARAFTDPDPQAVLDAAAADERLSPETRSALARVDRRGVRLSQMIVVRLRFERITNGSAEARRWFESDPAGFAAAFRSFVAKVPPVHPFPTDEALAFHTFCATELRAPLEG